MIVSIGGLPGSGKTSLILRVAEIVGATAVTEDVEDYALVQYANTSSPDLAFLNQADFLLTKIGQTLRMAASPALHLVEVDWVTCHVHWSLALARSNRISPRHAASLEEIYAAAMAAGIPRPSRTYFLTAPAGLVLSRVEHRNRSGETNYGPLLRDLAALDLVELERALGCPLRTLDAARSVEQLAQSVAADIRS